MRGQRILILLMFVVFSIAAVFLVASTIGGGEDAAPVAFTLFWLFALAWNAYWWLTRIAVALILDGKTLRWEAPLRAGELSLDEDLVEVRPMRLASNVVVFVCRGRRPILVPAFKGAREFVAEISRFRPDLPVRLGWQARLAERMPGRSRTSR
jgi:uncharacterized membrane protein YbhN (UPF0104 family)